MTDPSRPVRLFAELCAARVRWQQQRAGMFDVNNAWHPAFFQHDLAKLGRDVAWKASCALLFDVGALPDEPTGEEREAWEVLREKFPSIETAGREAAGLA